MNVDVDVDMKLVFKYLNTNVYVRILLNSHSRKDGPESVTFAVLCLCLLYAITASS